MKTTPSFIILEDHPLVREALAERLVSHFRDMAMAYSGSSIEAALDHLEQSPVDCVILDLDLNDNNSPLNNILALVEYSSPVLIVSALGDSATIRSALAMGVKGYVSKQAESAQLIEAIEAILRGEEYTSPEVATALLSAKGPQVKLSDQERRAMVLYASGLKMTSVARQMGITAGTADEYIKRVRAKYRKSGIAVSTKTDLYRVAQSEGLIP
ncbi:MAG: response regulator transcription factor [Candidatus Nanopelagicales bacterium]|nr:response regulator transcription factor [Candidatus Nanopelagicales bacterium]